MEDQAGTAVESLATYGQSLRWQDATLPQHPFCQGFPLFARVWAVDRYWLPERQSIVEVNPVVLRPLKGKTERMTGRGLPSTAVVETAVESLDNIGAVEESLRGTPSPWSPTGAAIHWD